MKRFAKIGTACLVIVAMTVDSVGACWLFARRARCRPCPVVCYSSPAVYNSCGVSAGPMIYGGIETLPPPMGIGGDGTIAQPPSTRIPWTDSAPTPATRRPTLPNSTPRTSPSDRGTFREPMPEAEPTPGTEPMPGTDPMDEPPMRDLPDTTPAPDNPFDRPSTTEPPTTELPGTKPPPTTPDDTFPPREETTPPTPGATELNDIFSPRPTTPDAPRPAEGGTPALDDPFAPTQPADQPPANDNPFGPRSNAPPASGAAEDGAAQPSVGTTEPPDAATPADESPALADPFGPRSTDAATPVDNPFAPPPADEGSNPADPFGAPGGASGSPMSDVNDAPMNDAPMNDAPMNDAPMNDGPMNDGDATPMSGATLPEGAEPAGEQDRPANDDLFAEPIGPRLSAARPVAEPAPEPADAMRVWIDATGKHQIRGRMTLILAGERKVRILKETGKYTTVPFAKLSETDRTFVARYTAEPSVLLAEKR